MSAQILLFFFKTPMNQNDLIESLGLSPSSFRRWRSALEILAKEVYSEEDLAKFAELKSLQEQGIKFDEAIAQILGRDPKESNPAEALAKRYGGTLQKEAKKIAGEMVAIFDDFVWAEFFQQLGTAKPSGFERHAQAYLTTIDTESALLLEGVIDEN